MVDESLPVVIDQEEANQHAEYMRQFRGKPFDRLTSMKCWPETLKMLKECRPIAEIVDFIQKINGEYIDVEAISVDRQLRRYFDTLPESEITVTGYSAKIRKALYQIVDVVDGLKYLSYLADIQLQRINRDFEVEKQINKNLATTGQDVLIAGKLAEMIETIKKDRLQYRMGVLDTPKREEGEGYVRRKYSEGMLKVFRNPESRRKIIDAVKRVSNLKDPVLEQFIESGGKK